MNLGFPVSLLVTCFNGRPCVEQTGGVSTGGGAEAFAVAPSIEDAAADPRAATWEIPEVEPEGADA